MKDKLLIMNDTQPLFYIIMDTVNENQGVVSIAIFILTIIFAWFTGFFKWLRDDIAKTKKGKKIICAWRISPSIWSEDGEHIEYKFGPIFHNKNDEIIKDFWINFSSSGFDMHLNSEPQMSLFDVWNIRNEAINLVLKNDERIAPQNSIEPFTIVIKLKKNLPEHGAWIYISYGISNSPKNELNYRLSYNELKNFIDGSKHSTEDFLKYIGATGAGYLRTKINRIFW